MSLPLVATPAGGRAPAWPGRWSAPLGRQSSLCVPFPPRTSPKLLFLILIAVHWEEACTECLDGAHTVEN